MAAHPTTPLDDDSTKKTGIGAKIHAKLAQTHENKAHKFDEQAAAYEHEADGASGKKAAKLEQRAKKLEEKALKNDEKAVKHAQAAGIKLEKLEPHAIHHATGDPSAPGGVAAAAPNIPAWNTPGYKPAPGTGIGAPGAAVDTGVPAVASGVKTGEKDAAAAGAVAGAVAGAAAVGEVESHAHHKPTNATSGSVSEDVGAPVASGVTKEAAYSTNINRDKEHREPVHEKHVHRDHEVNKYRDDHGEHGHEKVHKHEGGEHRHEGGEHRHEEHSHEKGYKHESGEHIHEEHRHEVHTHGDLEHSKHEHHEKDRNTIIAHDGDRLVRVHLHDHRETDLDHDKHY